MADPDLSALVWRKSSTSEETNCVEVAAACGLVMIRDSKNAGGGALVCSSRDWTAFVDRVRSNGFHASPFLLRDRAWPWIRDTDGSAGPAVPGLGCTTVGRGYVSGEGKGGL